MLTYDADDEEGGIHGSSGGGGYSRQTGLVGERRPPAGSKGISKTRWIQTGRRIYDTDEIDPQSAQLLSLLPLSGSGREDQGR
jgi:hypothetical protein